jgi:protease II
MSALARIPVGVVVVRRKAASPWIDFTWAPVSVLHGVPDTEPWTVLASEHDTTTFYAGRAEIALHRSETGLYRDNLATGAPSVWVVLSATERDPPYQLVTVTADPSEGEAFTESTANLVEQVAMPQSIQEIVAAFVAEHHVEREFFKRKRDRADPESLARRRGYGDHDE